MTIVVGSFANNTVVAYCLPVWIDLYWQYYLKFFFVTFFIQKIIWFQQESIMINKDLFVACTGLTVWGRNRYILDRVFIEY